MPEAFARNEISRAFVYDLTFDTATIRLLCGRWPDKYCTLAMPVLTIKEVLNRMLACHLKSMSLEAIYMLILACQGVQCSYACRFHGYCRIQGRYTVNHCLAQLIYRGTADDYLLLSRLDMYSLCAIDVIPMSSVVCLWICLKISKHLYRDLAI